MQNRNALIEQMINQYSDMVYRIAITRCRRKDLAEDVFQNVFLKYSEKMPSFESEEHAKAWFIRVTINFTKNENTSSWNNNVISISEEMQFADKEDYYVFDELQKLPENYRTVIYLMYYEGYKVNEIAELLDTPEGTIKTWLFRARDFLKNILEGDF